MGGTLLLLLNMNLGLAGGPLVEAVEGVGFEYDASLVLSRCHYEADRVLTRTHHEADRVIRKLHYNVSER